MKEAKRNLDSLLKETLLALYSDCPEIIHALHQLDFSKVNRKFRENLFSYISEDEYYKMDEILHSGEYVKYRDAVDRSSLAVTEDLAKLIELTLAQNEGKLN